MTLGQTYKLEVAAYNEVGEGVKSIPLSLLFANIPDAPATISLTASLSPTPNINTSWTWGS